MKYAELMEMIEEKPADVNLLRRHASWNFRNIQDKHSFMANLVSLLEEQGFLSSGFNENEEGEVQRIDYVFSKDHEAFEVRVFYDLKVELKEYGY